MSALRSAIDLLVSSLCTRPEASARRQAHGVAPTHLSTSQPVIPAKTERGGLRSARCQRVNRWPPRRTAARAAMGGELAPPLTGGAAVLARIKQARAAAEASAAQPASSSPAPEDDAPQVRVTRRAASLADISAPSCPVRRGAAPKLVLTAARPLVPPRVVPPAVRQRRAAGTHATQSRCDGRACGGGPRASR